MHRIPAFFLLLAVVSCSGSAEAPGDVRVDRPEDTMSAEADASVPLQYIAFCMDERAAVGPWTDSASDARSAGSVHTGKHPDHQCTLLWRQRP